MNEDPLVIGIGNTWRRDDGAGRIVARRLRQRAPAALTVVELDGTAAELLEVWRDHEAVVVVDAVCSGAAAGTIHRFDATGQELPAGPVSRSTHGLGAREAVRLGRALGRLPARLIVFGIEGRDFGHGTDLSPEVERALGKAEDVVLRELGLDLPQRAASPTTLSGIRTAPRDMAHHLAQAQNEPRCTNTRSS